MKRILNIVGSLFGLLVLVSLAVVLAMTFGGLQRGAQPASQAFQSPVSPVERPALPPDYILKKLTPPPILIIPPTVTRPPRPLPSPSPTPTQTPIPTPLPLPPSAFYALWAENFPEGQGSVLWLADPRDIGSRREVLRFDQDAIIEATLSPNGRKLALVTTYWKTSTLWVANADGTDLQQFDQSIPLGIRNLSWGRDSRMLAYNGVVAGEQTIIDKAGTPVVEPALLDTIELLDVTTGQKQHLVEVDPNEELFVIGWSTNGRELYYVRREIGYGYGLWVIDRISRKANKVIFLGTGDEPFFSLPELFPDGSKLLLNTPEGRAWISIDGRTRQDIPVPPWRQQCGLTWSVNKDELILCEVDEKEPIEHIKVLNLQTGEKRVLGSFRFPSNDSPFGPIAVSPDMQWMAATTYYGKDCWIHLPTGMMVPVPRPPGGRRIFIAWVPRMKAGR